MACIHGFEPSTSVEVGGLEGKSDAFEAFKEVKAWAENTLGLKIKALHDDKGGEYCPLPSIAS